MNVKKKKDETITPNMKTNETNETLKHKKGTIQSNKKNNDAIKQTQNNRNVE